MIDSPIWRSILGGHVRPGSCPRDRAGSASAAGSAPARACAPHRARWARARESTGRRWFGPGRSTRGAPPPEGRKDVARRYDTGGCDWFPEAIPRAAGREVAAGDEGGLPPRVVETGRGKPATVSLASGSTRGLPPRVVEAGHGTDAFRRAGRGTHGRRRRQGRDAARRARRRPDRDEARDAGADPRRHREERRRARRRAARRDPGGEAHRRADPARAPDRADARGGGVRRRRTAAPQCR